MAFKHTDIAITPLTGCKQIIGILLSIQKKTRRISKQLVFYKGYDLTQALYRLYYTEKRGVYKYPKDLKILNFI